MIKKRRQLIFRLTAALLSHYLSLLQPNSHIDFPLLIGFLSFRPVVLRLYIGTARRIPQRIAVFAFTGINHGMRLVGKTTNVALFQLCVFPRLPRVCDFCLLPDARAAGAVNLFVQPDVFSFRQYADWLQAKRNICSTIRSLVLQGAC